MKIVIIGDVGWRKFYHLGDEAMTEFALETLKTRGHSEITLIAGDPAYAAELYDVKTISRIGFSGNRGKNINRQRAILEYAESGGERGSLSPDDSAIPVIDAVNDSDAVLIAGGGNLNSMFAHHLYERSTLAKLAALFGKKYALTSQTIGPLIYDEDRSLLKELLNSAELVGARESHTLTLANELSSWKAKLFRQVDDAYSLDPRVEDREAVKDLVEKPFVLASFAEKASSPVMSDDQYHNRVVEISRQIADATGLRVLLVPHGGALSPSSPTRDQLTDLRIGAEAGSAAVVPTRMLTARELIALTESSQLVIGTRYHAGIFAAAAGVPFVSLAPNQYSSIRMRGAAENVGMEEFVLPFDSLEDIVSTAVGLVNEGAVVREFLQSVARRRRDEHREWWDFLWSAISPEVSSTSESPQHSAIDTLSNGFTDNSAVSKARLDAVEIYGNYSAIQARKLAVIKARLKRAEERLESASAEAAERAIESEVIRRVEAMETTLNVLRKDVSAVRRNTTTLGGVSRRLERVRAKLSPNKNPHT